VAAWCLLNYTPTFSANNESWFHYENDFFVAYSNAGEENVMNILRSLEQFRAAAFQIPSFVIPQGRPKTLVILPATHEEFLTYAYYETMAGFATVLARQPTIVLPASDPNLDLRVIVGHEFAHTLLFNDYFHYPSWYAEGFAEIASSIVIDPANNTFSIGARDDHRKKAAKSSIDWNDLTDSRRFPKPLARPRQNSGRATFRTTWIRLRTGHCHSSRRCWTSTFNQLLRPTRTFIPS
jgi:hypothetical protein